MLQISPDEICPGINVMLHWPKHKLEYNKLFVNNQSVLIT